MPDNGTDDLVDQAEKDLIDRIEQTMFVQPDDKSKVPEFVEYPLDEFLSGKALWAANYFILWPLGVALTVDVDGGKVSHLHVRHWRFPDGELGETIDLSEAENNVEYRKFLTYVHARFLALKPEERKLLLSRYGRHEIASAEQILLAVEP